MGYRDDLYRPVHMIGYTGKLGQDPSVYFYNPENGGFGHITQAHGVPANIGRGKYRDSPDYWMENRKGRDGRVALFESWDNGNGTHPSRNPFIPVAKSKFFPEATDDFRAIALLAPAIIRFPNVKMLSMMSRAQRSIYLAELRAQGALG